MPAISIKRPTAALLVFPLVLIVYLAFPTRNYYWDGIDFAHTIETARGLNRSLIHPNHLLYNFLGYVVFRAARLAFANLRALQVLQVINSFFSVMTAYVFFRILKTALRSTYLTWCLTLLFSFSAAWWKFSTDADAYIPSILFLLLSFYSIVRAAQPRPLITAVLFSISVCLHQIAVIFFPVLMLGLWWHPALRNRPRRVTVLMFSFAALAITVGVYGYCAYLSTGSLTLTNFMRWVTSHAPDESWGFHPWKNFLFTLRGHLRLLFGGRINLLSGLMNPPIVLLVVVLILSGLFLVFQILRNLRSSDWRGFQAIVNNPNGKRLALLCLGWILVYVIFLYCLLPHQTFYRLFYLPALLLLVGLVLDSYGSMPERSRKYRLASFVVVVALANFLFLIFPYSHVQKNAPLALALEMNKVWPPDTVVYFATTNADNDLFSYFNPQTIWKPMNPADPVELENDLREVQIRGGEAWLDASAIDRLLATPRGAEWLASYSLSDSRRQIADPAYDIKFIRILPRGK